MDTSSPMSLKQLIFGKLYLPIRFSVEQLSLIEVACDNEITNLYAERVAAKDANNTLVNIPEIDRRIREYRKVQRAIRGSLDEE